MEPTPPQSLFAPVQPGGGRILPAVTPAATPFGTPFSIQRPAPVETPVAIPPTRTPVPPVAPARPVATPMPVATPIPLFVPSDTATPAPPPTPEPVAGLPFEEDMIPSDLGPDLSAPRPLIDFPTDDPEIYEPVPTPPPAPIPGASPTPRPKPSPPPRAKPQSQPPSQAVAPSANQVQSWVIQANNTQDSALATRIGWAFFNRNDMGSASIWFGQALDWRPDNGEAAYGLALTKFREGDLSSAEAITNFRGASYPKMRALEGDIYAKRAFDYFEMRRYGQSLEYIEKAAAARPLSRAEQMLLAWDYYHTRNYTAAADLFKKLYSSQRDQQSAEGLYASLTKLEDYDQLDRLSTAGGPLKRVYATYEARRYYEAGLYRASTDVGGAKIYPELVNLNGPSVAGGFGYRTKSGQEGESQLNTGIAPVIQGQFSPAEKTIISAYIARITLDAGDLQPGANVGNAPREFTPYQFDPVTSYNNLWEFGVGFAYVDWWSFYFNLGTTPQNGPLSARPTGNAGIIYRDLQGYVQGEIYGRSIKETLLSYVGMEDPYTGQKWGRVIETGGSLSVFRSIPGNNTIFGKISYGWIDGTNVQDNARFSGVIAFAHEFTVKDFEFVTLGPAVSYESFDNNQNFFTYGHGGYFSPQYLLQGIIQAQFLTKEGRRWLAGGAVGAGIQTNEQNSSPYFPLNKDGRNYPGTSTTTGVGLINVTGGYLINPNWMIGGSAGYNITADYNEGYISIWARYFFERRNGLVRDDLGIQGMSIIY